MDRDHQVREKQDTDAEARLPEQSHEAHRGACE